MTQCLICFDPMPDPGDAGAQCCGQAECVAAYRALQRALRELEEDVRLFPERHPSHASRRLT